MKTQCQVKVDASSRCYHMFLHAVNSKVSSKMNEAVDQDVKTSMNMTLSLYCKNMGPSVSPRSQDVNQMWFLRGRERAVE